MLTNEAGRITDRYSYDACGSLLEKEGDTKNDFLYTGERYNANTGLYYLRARYMNTSTGTFISMDSYQGSVYDPVSLHKYLYAGVDPVQYTDPTGYNRLSETTVTQAGLLMIGASMLFAGTVALNIYSSLRKNMVSTAISLECTVSVTDWKNVILGFPAHDFDTKWIVTIPMALLSWQLFEAIYATDEDTGNLPGVPAREQDEKDKITGVPAQEQGGTKIIQNNTNSSNADDSRTANEIISAEKKSSIRREFPSEWLDKTREEINAAAKKGNDRAQKARKLLTDKDFNKSSNSTRSKKGK